VVNYLLVRYIDLIVQNNIFTKIVAMVSLNGFFKIKVRWFAGASSIYMPLSRNL